MTKTKWISCIKEQPKYGGEYMVTWKLDDGEYPTVTSMDWDAIEKRWTDPRGTGESENPNVLYWMELPDPPKGIHEHIWSGEPESISNKLMNSVYGQCIHGENLATCGFCRNPLNQ